jgi:mannose-6-phosphate isomerase-like protein (cupin superfamily)
MKESDNSAHNEPVDATSSQVRGEKAHIHVIDALRRLEAAGGARSIALFEHGSLQAKLYAPRGHDPQTPHARDEIYVVAQGSGTFYNGSTRRPFRVGDLLFAPAGSEHRFEDFTDDFAVWVMFFGPEGGEATA